MDKLEKLEQLIGVLDKDTVTQEEFVASFEQVLEFVKKIKESNDEHMEEVSTRANEAMDRCMMKMENAYASEWSKIRSKVDTLRNGSDYILTKEDKQEIAEMIVPPMFETPEKIIERTVVEQPIIKEVALKDSPEELVSKVNTSKTKISRDQVDGLRDIENMAKANQMPITTTFVNGKRAKNITFNNAVVAGDLANISIPVQSTAPENPTLGMLWIDSS